MNLEEGKKAIKEKLDEVEFFTSLIDLKSKNIRKILDDLECPDQSSSSTSSSSTSSTTPSSSSSSSSSESSINSSTSSSSTSSSNSQKLGIVSPTNDVQLDPTEEVTLRWTGPDSMKFDIRCNDNTDKSLRLPGNNCGVNKHYLCRNGVRGKEFKLKVTPGHTYRWWVHVSGTTPAVIGYFSVASGKPDPVSKRVTFKDRNFRWKGENALFAFDTSWRLLSLSELDIIHYLDNRKSLGYNAILVDLMGPKILNSNDTLYDPFFNKVEFLLQELAKRNMWASIGIAAVYDVIPDSQWTPVSILPLSKCQGYAEKVTRRLAKYDNIPFYFIVALDATRDLSDPKTYANKLGSGAKAGDPTRLVTQHAKHSHTSIDRNLGLPLSNYHEFPTVQSGHSHGKDPAYVEGLYKEIETAVRNKPIVNLEPVYEHWNGITAPLVKTIAKIDAERGSSIVNGNIFIIGIQPEWKQHLNDAGTKHVIEQARTMGTLTPFDDGIVVPPPTGELKGLQYKFSFAGLLYDTPLWVVVTLTTSDAIMYQIPNPGKDYDREIVPLMYPVHDIDNPFLYPDGQSMFAWKANDKATVTIKSGTSIKRVALRAAQLGPEFEQGEFIGDNSGGPVEPPPPGDGDKSVARMFVHREMSSAHNLGHANAITVAKSGKIGDTIRLYPHYGSSRPADSLNWFENEMHKAKNEGCIGYAVDLEGNIIRSGPSYCAGIYERAQNVGIKFWWEPKIFDGTGSEPAGHLTRHWGYNYRQGIEWLQKNSDGNIFWLYAWHADNWIKTFKKLRGDGLTVPLIPLGDAIKRTTGGQATTPFNAADSRMFHSNNYGVGFFVPGSITNQSMASEGVREAKRLY